MPITIKQVASVQYGRSFDWKLKFDSSEYEPKTLPKDFKDWFPAVDVSLSHWDLSNYGFETVLGTTSIPKSRNQTPIRITFLDNDEKDLENFFISWGLFIKNANGVRPLEECVKRIYIDKLSVKKETVSTYSFIVAPEGNFQDEMNNNSNAKTFSLDFKIHGGGLVNKRSAPHK